MIDVTMLALVVVCFGLAIAYAYLCDHLLVPAADQDMSQ